MEDAIKVECEILQSQLERVGRKIPLAEIVNWPVAQRVQAEQWAVAKHWSTLKNPPKAVPVPEEPPHVVLFAVS